MKKFLFYFIKMFPTRRLIATTTCVTAGILTYHSTIALSNNQNLFRISDGNIQKKFGNIAIKCPFTKTVIVKDSYKGRISENDPNLFIEYTANVIDPLKLFSTYPFVEEDIYDSIKINYLINKIVTEIMSNKYEKINEELTSTYITEHNHSNFNYLFISSLFTISLGIFSIVPLIYFYKNEFFFNEYKTLVKITEIKKLALENIFKSEEFKLLCSSYGLDVNVTIIKK